MRSLMTNQCLTTLGQTDGFTEDMMTIYGRGENEMTIYGRGENEMIIYGRGGETGLDLMGWTWLDTLYGFTGAVVMMDGVF